jgi:putative ABC transport system permease protein
VDAPTPDEVYLPLRQAARQGMFVLAKTDGDPAALQGAMARAVARVDPSQAVAFFATLDSTVADSVGSQRLMATLTGVFAALAFGLSLTGLYSVLAYLVTQRTPEIGIRMALGASRRQVVALVMGNGLALVAVGLVLGLAGAAAAARLIRQQLFGIEPLNLAVYAGVAAMFAAVAALACLAPSLRASRIDPIIAFRAE